MRERILYLDSIRGFAIFLVVLGHSIAWTYPNWQVALECGNISTMVLWRLIYSFHMPLFFFVSALLYRPGNPYSLLKRRITSLLIPFLFLGGINCALQGKILFEEFPWFLRTLFEFTLIEISYEAITSKCKCLNNKFVIHLSYMLMTYYVINLFFERLESDIINKIWDIDHFTLFNYLGYCCGILFREKPNLEKKISFRHMDSLLVLIFLFLSFISFHNYSIPFSLYLIPLSAILITYRFFKNNVYSGIIVTYFNKIGKYTLQIYLLHVFFRIRIVEVGKYLYDLSLSDDFSLVLTSTSVQVVYNCLIAVIMIKLSLLLGEFISKFELLNYLFFGKKINS